ncbi:MAG: endonuclease [Bacteroidales bacterium]|nr:endonuclease [Bacteroidales bacterium]
MQQNRNIFQILLPLFLLFSGTVPAQIPDGYYDDAVGLTGDELKAALHNIIDDHQEFSYNALRDYILKNTDEDPGNSNHVILLYSGISRAKSDFGGNSGDWNREHVWAKSHGNFGTSPPAGTDAHHIRPSDVQINSLRGNLDFDLGGSDVPNCPGCKKDGDSFEPPDRVKGDVARMIFYMATRYEGGGGEPDLEVVDAVNTYPGPEHGKLSALLEWNTQDPPDDFEKNRNDVIYYQYQENRNPFIDHPEFVNDIWGDPQSVGPNHELGLACYPNPVANKVFVEYSFNSTLGFSLFYTDGSLIAQGKLNSGKSGIDMATVANGLYLLVLRNEDGSILQQYKLIKTK